MCGFVGILGPEFAERGVVLRAMLACIAHRGPDGEGIYEDENLALGHRRLAIFDTSDAAAQPMQHPGSGQVLAFNGAIYNHPELRQSLKEPPRSSGDTEVLLRMLAEYGEDAVAALNGMWAFAFWDPAHQRLWLSRDRLGVKPLYWRRWGELLLFGSEPQALLAVDETSPGMDVDAFGTFLMDRTLNHSSRSFFQGIQQLPPASLLRIEAAQATKPTSASLFWTPDQNPIDSESDLAELLDESVRLRMRSDVSCGYLVSGGLDSSSILASAARQQAGGRLQAYTLRYDDVRDESPQARAIVEFINQDPAAQSQIDLHYIEPSNEDLGDALDHLIQVQGEPFSDGSMLAHYLLMQAVSAAGHKVVVGGLGGDEALAGYIGPYSRAFAVDQLLRGRVGQAIHIAGGGIKNLMGCGPHVPPVGLRNPLRRWLQARQLSGWLRPGIMEHVYDRYPQERSVDSGRKMGRYQSYLRAGLRQWALPGFTHYEDRNAMHFGLEARAPLLDYQIIEWGLAQPAQRLIADGLGKLALREAMVGRLPEAILWQRKKRGLPAPTDAWLQENVDWVEAALAAPGPLQDWLDTDRIWKDYRLALASGSDLLTALGGWRVDVLWRVVTAARWAALNQVRN